jgi:DNA-binding transcriptional ArsR family regulator
METHPFQAYLSKALAPPTRLQVLGSLSKNVRNSELMMQAGTRQSSLSRHLAPTRQQEVVVARRVGTNVYDELLNPRIIDSCSQIGKLLVEWLEREHCAVTSLGVSN